MYERDDDAPTCESCVYFAGPHADHPLALGLCHRYPTANSKRGVEWCGEHQDTLAWLERLKREDDR